jgi:pantoate kinase
MVREVVAFCPGHISGYFKPVFGTDVATTGSIGAGIVISEGVVARAEQSGKISVRVWKKDRSGVKKMVAHDSPPLTHAMNLLSLTANVTTDCNLPIGSGFGLSAASLLATLTALDQLYELGLGGERITRVAHEAEITCRTGLGDVAACQGGGFVVRTIAGITAPVRRDFNLPEPLYAVNFGPIHTPSVLGSGQQMDRVTSAFPPEEPKDLEEFFRFSRTFAEQSGLVTPRVQEALVCCDDAGVPASMTMLGNGVFAYGKDAREVLLGFGRSFELHVAHHGPTIVEAAV